MKKILLNVLLASSLCGASLSTFAEEYNLSFSVYKSAGAEPELFNEINTLIKADENAKPMVSTLAFKNQDMTKSYELQSYLGKVIDKSYPYLFKFTSEKVTLRGIEQFNLSEKVLLKPNETISIEKVPYTVKIKLSPLTK